MKIGNKNTIPAISNLPGQGNPGSGPVPPSGGFVELQATLFLMALESAITNTVQLEQ